MSIFLFIYLVSLERERARVFHQAKLASLGEMAAGIAHEINNPLAIISANMLLLPAAKDDQVKFKTKVESVNKAVARIEKIVSGLRKFSRTDTENKYEAVILMNLVDEVVVQYESILKYNTVSLETNLKTHAKVLCDPAEIEQVLINLINNSIYALKDLPSKWIEIDLFEEGEDVVVRVMDSGLGIPKEIEQKIFQPFFTTKPVNEGTGIGLSISMGILKKHKAKFFLNRLIKNTCFEIRFKKAPVEL